MASVIFMVTNSRFSSGPERFTVLRIREERLDTIAHFETLDEAKLAAERYADKARLVGLATQVVVREERKR